VLTTVHSNFLVYVFSAIQTLKLSLLRLFFVIFLGCGFFVKNIVDPMDVLKIFVRKRDPDMAIR
jgi:hypothetical protein